MGLETRGHAKVEHEKSGSPCQVNTSGELLPCSQARQVQPMETQQGSCESWIMDRGGEDIGGSHSETGSAQIDQMLSFFHQYHNFHIKMWFSQDLDLLSKMKERKFYLYLGVRFYENFRSMYTLKGTKED